MCSSLEGGIIWGLDVLQPAIGRGCTAALFGFLVFVLYSILMICRQGYMYLCTRVRRCILQVSDLQRQAIRMVREDTVLLQVLV